MIAHMDKCGKGGGCVQWVHSAPLVEIFVCGAKKKHKNKGQTVGEVNGDKCSLFVCVCVCVCVCLCCVCAGERAGKRRATWVWINWC
jgi:hypothetical protein